MPSNYPVKKECPQCGKEFLKTRSWQTFCSSHCRMDSFQKRKKFNEEEENAKIETRLEQYTDFIRHPEKYQKQTQWIV